MRALEGHSRAAIVHGGCCKRGGMLPAFTPACLPDSQTALLASQLSPLSHCCFMCSHRPELKFASLDDLLGRINTDIGIARSQLDLPQWQAYRGDAFLQQQ